MYDDKSYYNLVFGDQYSCRENCLVISQLLVTSGSMTILRKNNKIVFDHNSVANISIKNIKHLIK